jgi:hypothetical protein
MTATISDRDARINRDVELAAYQATGYVWGRQDAGESTKDTLRSIEFGRAYGARKRAYLEERAWFMPNIRDAFEEWTRTGTIALR